MIFVSNIYRCPPRPCGWGSQLTVPRCHVNAYFTYINRLTPQPNAHIPTKVIELHIEHCSKHLETMFLDGFEPFRDQNRKSKFSKNSSEIINTDTTSGPTPAPKFHQNYWKMHQKMLKPPQKHVFQCFWAISQWK